jgi:hypothetical protein
MRLDRVRAPKNTAAPIAKRNPYENASRKLRPCNLSAFTSARFGGAGFAENAA